MAPGNAAVKFGVENLIESPGFGSVKLIESASIEDMKKINGISDFVANKIYNFFNKNNLISKK